MKRITRHLSYANIMATVAVVFAMTGGAIAATGGFTSGGRLQACVNEEGRLKLLKSGERCKRSQKSVIWNQTGPAGAKGAAGASGAVGPAGAAGASIQGPKGAPGDERVKWAIVGAAGNIESQRGIVKVSGTKSPYSVQFDSDISQCAVVADADVALLGRIYTNVGLNTDRNPGDRTEENIFAENVEDKDVAARFSVVAYC